MPLGSKINWREDTDAFRLFRNDYPRAVWIAPLVRGQHIHPHAEKLADVNLKSEVSQLERLLSNTDAFIQLDAPSFDLTPTLGWTKDAPPTVLFWKESPQEPPLRGESSLNFGDLYLNPRGTRAYFQWVMWYLEVRACRGETLLFHRGLSGNEHPKVTYAAYGANNRTSHLLDETPRWMFPASLAAGPKRLYRGQLEVLGDPLLESYRP